MLFHITSTQGRADSYYLESLNLNKLLYCLRFLTTSAIRNIKEVCFSKDYNINYVSVPYVKQDSWHKVVIIAESEHYAQTYTLFNVKKSVSDEIIKSQFKKLFIRTEKITSIFDIQYYNSADSDIDYENLYQVQYKRESKTYLENFYCDSWQNAKDIFDTLIDGEITEIRKFVHHDNTIIKDDGKYHKRVGLYSTDKTKFFKLSLFKVKKTISHDDIIQTVKDNLQFNNKDIVSKDIKIAF